MFKSRFPASILSFLTLLGFCLFPILPVHADPTISNVSGTLAHKAAITISGSSFGSKSPAAPLWWDDMEGHTVNVHSTEVLGSGDLPGVVSSLPSGSRHYSAAWPKPGIQPAAYRIDEAMMMFRADGWDSSLETTGNRVDAPHQYSAKYAAGCHYEFSDEPYAPADGMASGEPRFRDDGVFYDNVGLTVSRPSSFTTFVAYWYYRLDPAMFNDDDAGGDDIRFNGKFLNIEQGYDGFNAGMYEGPGFKYRSWERRPEEENSGKTVTMNIAFNCSSGTYDDMTNPRFEWIHLTHIGDDSTNIEQVYEGGDLVAGGTGCTSMSSMYGYTYGGFHGACNTTTHPGCTPQNNTWFGCKDCYKYFDDLYLDTTFSRVELCNHATHSSATLCEPQIPSAWSTSSITVTVNQGALTGDRAYLFVFDSNNNRNAQGYPVSLNGSPPPDTPPASPTGLEIVPNP